MSEERAEQLEQEISRTRGDVDRVLSALEQKLSPGQILDDFMNKSGAAPKEFALKLGAQVKDNPIPALLTVIGIGWLAASSRNGSDEASLSDEDRKALTQYRRLQRLEDSPSRMQGEDDVTYDSRVYYTRAAILDLDYGSDEDIPTFKSKVDEAHTSLRERVKGMLEKFERSAGHAKHGLMEAAGNVKHAAQSMTDKAKGMAAHGKESAESMKNQTKSMMRTAQDIHESNPLLTGAVLFAVGAAVGAMTPNTRAEDELMANAKQKFKDDLSQRTSAVKEEAVSLAKETAQRASQKFREASAGTNGTSTVS